MRRYLTPSFDDHRYVHTTCAGAQTVGTGNTVCITQSLPAPGRYLVLSRAEFVWNNAASTAVGVAQIYTGAATGAGTSVGVGTQILAKSAFERLAESQYHFVHVACGGAQLTLRVRKTVASGTVLSQTVSLSALYLSPRRS